MPNGFDLSGGSLVAEFVWCFLVWERGRGPGQESTDFSFDQIARRRIPAQTWASRIGLSPEGLGAGPVRFFFVARASPTLAYLRRCEPRPFFLTRRRGEKQRNVSCSSPLLRASALNSNARMETRSAEVVRTNSSRSRCAALLADWAGTESYSARSGKSQRPSRIFV